MTKCAYPTRCHARTVQRAEPAEAAAREFVARLKASASGGDFGGAAAMWSGYPYPGSQRPAHLEAFGDRSPWLLDGHLRFDVLDAWSSDPAVAMSVVAITDLRRRGTAALLIDRGGTIQRIQTDGDPDGPVTVGGDRIIVPPGPVEGGAVAYLSGEPVDSVAVDPRTGAVIIALGDLPESAGRSVLIVSTATPELPAGLSVFLPG